MSSTHENSKSRLRRLWEEYPRTLAYAAFIGGLAVGALGINALESPEREQVCDTVTVNGEDIITPLQIAGKAAVKAGEEDVAVAYSLVETAASQIPNPTNVGDTWKVCYGPDKATAERTTHPLLVPTSPATPQS